MNLNVFNWPYSKHYYLTHPWKWITEFFRNCAHAWHRVKYGWTWEDVWNMDDWLLNVLPPMLRHMAKHGMAYPGCEPFETPEKWHDWLNSLADVLESLQEKNWYSQNEYEEDFHRSCPLNYNKNFTWATEPNYKEISKLYFARSRELGEERKKLLAETFTELGKNLNFLWD